MGKKRDFAAYGLELSFDDAAYRWMAREAMKHKTGARGLVSVVENLLLPFERSLPSTTVSRLHVTEELCRSSEEFLRQLLLANAFESLCFRFQQNGGIKLEFSPRAKEEAVAAAAAQGKPLPKYLQDTLKDYEYGLKLIGRDSFTVTKSVLDDPKGYLDNLVKKVYKTKQEG